MLLTSSLGPFPVWALTSSCPQLEVDSDWKWTLSESKPRPEVDLAQKWVPTGSGSKLEVGPASRMFNPIKAGPFLDGDHLGGYHAVPPLVSELWEVKTSKT